MRRAAISIPANIAEGFKKRGVKDKIRLLNVLKDQWKKANII
jgi:four helix bundle protein